MKQGSLDSSSQINQQVPRTPTFLQEALSFLRKVRLGGQGRCPEEDSAASFSSLEDDKSRDSQSAFPGNLEMQILRLRPHFLNQRLWSGEGAGICVLTSPPGVSDACSESEKHTPEVAEFDPPDDRAARAPRNKTTLSQGHHPLPSKGSEMSHLQNWYHVRSHVNDTSLAFNVGTEGTGREIRE